MTTLVRHSQVQNVFRFFFFFFYPSFKLLWKFKFFFGTFNWLLTGLLMPPSKHNSIMAIATGLMSFFFPLFTNTFSYLFVERCGWMGVPARFYFFTFQCPFVPRCDFSPTAAALALISRFHQSLSLLSFVIVCSPFLSSTSA